MTFNCNSWHYLYKSYNTQVDCWVKSQKPGIRGSEIEVGTEVHLIKCSLLSWLLLRAPRMESPGILLSGGEGNYLRIESFSWGHEHPWDCYCRPGFQGFGGSQREKRGMLQLGLGMGCGLCHGSCDWNPGALRECHVGSGSTCASLLCVHACFHSVLYLWGEWRKTNCIWFSVLIHLSGWVKIF